ncbi:MAG TPA: ferritin-like domain-containing protein [Longimicrobium sp.]|nr:ferritin-like domain-containing protein [Longimicrobium sp.]
MRAPVGSTPGLYIAAEFAAGPTSHNIDGARVSALAHPPTPESPMHFPSTPATRRDFVRGALLGAATLLVPLTAACNDSPVNPAARATLDLRGDTGRLNGIYALLQLKGELFERIRRAPYPAMTRAEMEAVTDIVDHTTAHIQYLTRRLRDRRVYDLLLFDFTTTPLTSRAAALGLARSVADSVAAAHVWAVEATEDPALAGVLAGMGSVHARHAATVRGFVLGDAGFAAAPAVSAATGLTLARPLAGELEAVRPLFLTRLQIQG